MLVLVVAGCANVGSAPGLLGRNEDLRSRRLMVPVAGVAPEAVSDTFWAPRDGGRRMHRALDILAPRGTRVLAADDGRVMNVGWDRLGGRTIYAVDPTGSFLYYYAHLAAYAPGMSRGAPLRRGQVIGYVGTSGNSPPDVPHLHFQVMLYDGGPRLDGRPLNPHGTFASAGRPR